MRKLVLFAFSLGATYDVYDRFGWHFGYTSDTEFLAKLGLLILFAITIETR